VKAGWKVSAFAGGLAATFALAFAAGSAIGPSGGDQRAAGSSAHGAEPMPGMTESAHGEDGGHEAEAGQLPGLAVSDAGYTLVPKATTLPAGAAVPFQFTVTDPAGRPLTSYTTRHDKELHLIVVRRDLDGFQHVHPDRAADGTWSVPLNLAKAGGYRVFADFAPAALGRGLVLGADVSVAGAFTPVSLPAPATTASADGYDVSLSGAPMAGTESELVVTVTRNGKPVTDLEPYLGAFGHLVTLRSGDLAYLHTHPAHEAHAGEHGGPRVQFTTTFPTAGTYRLFLDFQRGGKVRTAAFTVVVPTH
jgi:hypothetical protein